MSQDLVIKKQNNQIRNYMKFIHLSYDVCYHKNINKWHDTRKFGYKIWKKD